MTRKCTIITVANLKGGVGKTTSVTNLAAALAAAGKQILVVDLDFQGNATTGLGLDRNDGKSNVHQILIGKTSLEEAITPSPIAGIDLVASHRNLLEYAKSNNAAVGREYLFEDWKDSETFGAYDVVIFDTHPDMDCLTLSALVVSDYYLVPLFAELDPIVGLSDMFQQVELVKKRYNKGLSLLGVLVTKFEKTESTHRKLEAKIREGAKRGNYSVFKTTIPASKRLSSSKLMGRPVVHTDPRSNVAKAFADLAKELAPKLKAQGGKKKKPIEKTVNFKEIEKEIVTELEAESSELI